MQHTLLRDSERKVPVASARLHMLIYADVVEDGCFFGLSDVRAQIKGVAAGVT